MSKKTKIWLIIATSLVVLGLIMFVAVMTLNDWNFTKLSTVKYETNTYEVSEEFSNISINADTEDIFFVLSKDSECKVVCVEQANSKRSVTVQNGQLTIDTVNEKKWYEYIGVNFGNPKITVYIPQSEYGELSVKASTGDVSIKNDLGFANIGVYVSTGDIRVQNVSVDTLELSVSTGKVAVVDVHCKDEINVRVSTGKTNITDTKCQTLISNGGTGDISLRNVIAEESFSIERSTGDVEFEKCDATEIYVKTDTGDVEGSLLSDKVFIIRTDTGDIDVPKTTTGGKCEITTDTGDIEIDIE